MKCGFSTDLVHDAYIRWFNKTGNNLFLEREGTVMATMKWTIKAHRGQDTRMYFGKNISKRQYTPLITDNTEANNEFLVGREPNQIEYCSYNETMELFDKLSGSSKIVFDYLVAGYTPVEIKEMDGTSCERVRWHVNKFRKMAGIESNGKAFSWGRRSSK